MFKTTVLKLMLFCGITIMSIQGYSLSRPPAPILDPEPEPCEIDCNFQQGPDPTQALLESEKGPFTVLTYTAPRSVAGFGGGTIHYPDNIDRSLAAIVIAPGFSAAQSSIRWWGPRLSSHGFVVLTIDTNTIFDNPASRTQQLNQALNYLLTQNRTPNSPIRGLIDPTRLGSMGWSMGGGGTLGLALERELKAIIPLAPWNTDNILYDQIQSPTLIIACENDFIAPVRDHAAPFYSRLSDETSKAFLEIRNGRHTCANGGGANGNLLGRYGVAWMKRFLDLDLRYSPFLCGPNHLENTAISKYEENCNY